MNKEQKDSRGIFLEQIRNIKGMAVGILAYQKNRLTIVEKTTVNDIYELMDNIFLDNINNKRFTTEEFVDARLVEYSMLLSKTKNSKIKELLKVIKEGIKW